MAMVINNMYKPTINVTEVPEDTDRRVDIFIGGDKYKEANRKDTTSKEKLYMYSLLTQQCTPEM